MRDAGGAALPPFQVFFERTRGAIYRLLVSLVGPVEAEDAFQETFLAALRAYPRLTDETNLEAWVVTIARRKAIDLRRARGRAPVPQAELPPAAAVEAAGADGDPDLWQAVEALPPKQRAAVVLRFVNDLSHREIAEALGSSEAAARQNLREGLKTLREGRRDAG